MDRGSVCLFVCWFLVQLVNNYKNKEMKKKKKKKGKYLSSFERLGMSGLGYLRVPQRRRTFNALDRYKKVSLKNFELLFIFV